MSSLRKIQPRTEQAAAAMSPAAPAGLPQIEDVWIRELEENARAALSWPSRMMYAFVAFTLSFGVAFVLVSRLGVRGTETLGCVPFLYIAALVLGWAYVSNRGHDRVWASEPSPEPGRVFRRLAHLGFAGIGVCILAIAAIGVVAVFDERRAVRMVSSEILSGAFVVNLGGSPEAPPQAAGAPAPDQGDEASFRTETVELDPSFIAQVLAKGRPPFQR